MDTKDFCYWLRGFTEVTDNKMPNKKEWRIICDHLDLVFNKVTPDRNKIIGQFITPSQSFQTGILPPTKDPFFIPPAGTPDMQTYCTQRTC